MVAERVQLEENSPSNLRSETVENAEQSHIENSSLLLGSSTERRSRIWEKKSCLSRKLIFWAEVCRSGELGGHVA